MASRRDFVKRMLAGTAGIAVAPSWALAEIHRLVPEPIAKPIWTSGCVSWSSETITAKYAVIYDAAYGAWYSQPLEFNGEHWTEISTGEYILAGGL